MYLFFFNDTATTEIYTLSLHDALPIYRRRGERPLGRLARRLGPVPRRRGLCLARRPARDDGGRELGRLRLRRPRDRKSTRLNSSHANISYAVFCLKKKTILYPRH